MSNEIKRMRYFNGLLLKEEDLTLEQNYYMRLHRLHNRYFHDWGIMDGLEVEAVVGTPQVKVSQGMALNRVFIEETNEEQSQEIWICDNHPDNPVDLSNYTPGDNIYITVCYEEIPADIDHQKGGHEIHVWERARIKHSIKKPDDPRKEIILALVRMDADEAGNKTIREISDTDIDGETKLRTYAVLRGKALEVDKLSVGPKDKLYLPYISGLNDSQIGEGDGLDIHSPFTRFTGSVISSSINALGNVDIKGALTVTTNNKQALKVNPVGNVDITGATTVGGKLSVAGGLTVRGDNATIDTAQVTVTGNMVTLNKYTPEEGETEPKNQSSGIEVYRGGTAPNVRLIWDESEKVWKAGMDKRDDIPGSGMYAVAYGTAWENMHNGSNVDGMHKHSQICAPDGNVALSAGTSGDIDIQNSVVASGSVVSKGGSFEVPRPGALPNAKLIWNENAERWQINVGDQIANIPYGSAWEELTTGTNADSLHTHSQFFNADGSAMALRINSAGDVDISSDLTVGQNLTVVGNLNVLGQTTTVSTQKLEVADNVIIVNRYEQGMPPINEGGLEVYRGGTLPNARIIWDEGSNQWKIGTGSSMVEIPYGSQWEELTHGAVTESLHKHGHLYTEGGSAVLGVDEDGNTEAQGNVSVNGGLIVDKNAQIKGILAVDGSLTIGGDLTVNGTTTTVNTKTLEVDDKVIVVNKYTGEDSPLEGQSGLEVYRGSTAPNAKIVWDETEEKWKAGTGDDVVGLAYGEEWDTLTSNTSADSLHRHCRLCRTDGNTALSIDTEGKIEMYGDTEVKGMFSVGGSVTVDGDLVVKGTAVKQVDMEITDNVIVLNKYEGGISPVNESGIEIYRGQEKDRARIVWDEILSKWRMGIGSELQDIAGGSSWGMLTNQDNADSLHMHSQVYNENGNILALSASASGNVDVAHGMTVGQNLKVLGSLDVRGELTTISTTAFEVRSNTVVVNRYEPGTTPLGTDSGLTVYRGLDLPNAVVIWDENNNRWKIGASADNPGLIVNSDGSIMASGNMQAAEANIEGSLRAGSANIQGSLTVKTGIEVPRDPEPKAYFMWDEVMDQWKMGTGSDTAISVTASGNLGVGTEVPKAELDVNGNAVVSGNLIADSTTVNDSLTVNGSLVLGNGLEVQRGADPNGYVLPKARILWDKSKNKWLFGVEGDMQEVMLTNHKHNNLYNWDGTITALSADSKGNIGIGTTTPMAKLDVSGDVLINGKLTIKTGLEISRGSDPKAKIYWDETSDKWQAGTEGDLKDISLSDHKHQNLYTLSGTAVVNVDTSGNVAIGKPTPTSKLDVAGTMQATNVTVIGTLTTGGSIEVNRTMGANAQLIWDEATGRWQAGTADNLKELSFSDHKHSNIYTPDGTAAMNVDAGGNIGIGITAPNAKLDVQGDAKVSGLLTTAEVSVSGSLSAASAAVNGDLSAGNAAISGTLNAANATVSGSLSAASAAVSGDLSAGNAAISGTLNTTNATVSGSLSATSAAVNGDLSAGNAAISGTLNTTNATVSGSLSATSAAVNGDLSAGNAAISGTLNAANATVSGSLSAASATIANDLTVDGNLTVNGSMVTVNTETLEVEDSVVRVNKYAPQTEPANVNGGLEVFRGGTAANAQLIWDEATAKWQAGTENGLKEISLSGHKHQTLCTADGTVAINLDEAGNIGIGKTPDPNFKLDVDGQIQAATFVQTSSQSYKENIAELTAKTALDLLNKLNPVSFDFKADSSKKHNIGFIAEEVPDIFTTSDRKSVALMDIIGVLTTVVKKQQKETTVLKKQVNALQKQITSLISA